MAEKYEIIGVDKKAGNYEGHDYENYYLHCKTVNNASIAGKCVKAFKIKGAAWRDMVAGYADNDLIGKKFTPYFDQYQMISKLDFDK